jgi:hypothetical protein
MVLNFCYNFSGVIEEVFLIHLCFPGFFIDIFEFRSRDWVSWYRSIFFCLRLIISWRTVSSNVELKNHKNHFRNEFVKAFFSDINFNQKKGKTTKKIKSFLGDFFKAKNLFKKNEKLSTNHNMKLNNEI